MIKLTIVGCCGRMGRRISSLAFEDKEIRVAGATEISGSPFITKDLGEILGIGNKGVTISDDILAAAKSSEVIVDFTTPTSTISSIKDAKELKIPIVIGTTGLTDEELTVVHAASSKIPLLFSSNMSLGVNMLFSIIGDIANRLSEDYNIEIVETHHNKKKDAPSGTAKRLAEIIADARGLNLDNQAVYGRKGKTGERKKEEIGIHAVRAGDIVGEHTVIFAGKNERIELTHRAHSRDVFAAGAISAAKFIVNKSPGLYNMQDVLGGV